MSKHLHILLWMVLGCGVWSLPSLGWAQEQRVALLVVNQKGWAKDPFLRYAVRGDLQPLSRELQRLGFRVKALINKTPQELRQAMKALALRMKRQAGAKTFLFYYSGHADRSFLHMGPKKKKPFSYKEFLSLFQQVPSQRRLAIFDACFSGEVIRLFGSVTRYRKLLQEGRLKGVRRPSTIDISRLTFPSQGQEQGMRIITSSLQMSWELNRYRASVFTYHLLRGIRGAADLDNDGKISVDELFDFTSREVKQITGQKPQQLVVARRARPYALAPAYRSRLRIDAQVTGTLRVSVANFMWSHRKRKRKPLTLALVHGKGVVQLRSKGRCWVQPVSLPKGGERQLGKRWQPVPCGKKLALRSKGVLTLPARIATFRSPLDAAWRALGVSAGMALQGSGALQRLQPTFSLAFQWRWLQTSAGFSHGFTGDSSFSLTRIFLQGAAGVPLTWGFSAGRLRLFAGGFVRAGLVLQHDNAGTGALNLHGVAGGLVQLSWWFSRWGIQLGTSGGLDITPTARGAGLSPFWQLSSAVVFSI